MKKLLAILLVAVMILGVAACTQKPTPTDAPTKTEEVPGGETTDVPAPSGEPIKIGLPAPMSGSSGAIGPTLRDSAQLAIDEWNAKGGVHGRPVELLVEDDEMNATKAVAAANKLIFQDEVDAIIGCLNSTACMAVQEITNAEGMIQIALGSNKKITELGHKYVFRVQANDLFQAGDVVKYVCDTLGLTKVACIYASDDYGTGGKNVVVDELAKRGLEAVAIETFAPDASDVTSQLTSIKNAQPEALILWCMYQPGALICNQMAQLGMDNVQKFGGGGLVNPALYELAKENAAGLCMAQLFYPSKETANDKGKAFIDNYVAKYGKNPDNNCGMTYDAANILLEAMNNAPETMTADEVAAEIHKLTHDGVSGSLTFTEQGDVIRNLAIVQLNAEGKYDLVFNPNA